MLEVDVTDSLPRGHFAREASADSADKNAGPRGNPRFALSASCRNVRQIRSVRTFSGGRVTPGCASAVGESRIRDYICRAGR